jgi:transcriptional regulator with XRE-family HTH domain
VVLVSMLKPYKTNAIDIQDLKKKSIGERVFWIREKAEEVNKSYFTRYRVAEKTGIAFTTIVRIEENEVKNPQIAKLESIADYLGVPAKVFFDEYYEGVPEGFIICEPKELKLEIIQGNPLDLMSVTHVIELVVRSKSTISDFTDIPVDEIIEVTPLDYEEFIDEVKALAKRLQKRRLSWQNKKNAAERLKKKGE